MNGRDPSGTDGQDIGAGPDVGANSLATGHPGITVQADCGGGCLSGQAASDYISAQGSSSSGFSVGNLPTTVSEVVVVAKKLLPKATVKFLPWAGKFLDGPLTFLQVLLDGGGLASCEEISCAVPPSGKITIPYKAFRPVEGNQVAYRAISASAETSAGRPVVG